MKLALRIISALLVLVGIIWLIVHPGYDSLTAFLTAIFTFLGSFVVDKKGDTETVDQRNRRIMLGHVENFWVKGILEKSLYGAALLELGIKEDPDAVKTYPWAIKRETNKETLPASKSMLEIFQEIGMGRSLLILGAPGAGKTTMLLELTLQLIARAREDVTEPIPVVFNLSSWTEKLTIAAWLAKELNIIYTIPKKIAPNWVKENKMLLLLDGLDEVRPDSRDKCVEAINQFRKEYGLTSMAVCSRIQDYAERKTRLSFDGAIEIQSLTSKQVDEYFNRFGNQLAGIRQVLEKDRVLREMAETPLFLSIMTLAYRDTQIKDILVSENLNVQRKHLFDTYIERMFERPMLSKNEMFNRQNVLYWLSWLAKKITSYDAIPYMIENMQPKWLSRKQQGLQGLIVGTMAGPVLGLAMGPIIGLALGIIIGLSLGLALGMISYGLIVGLELTVVQDPSEMVGSLITWDWKKARRVILGNRKTPLIQHFLPWLYNGLILGFINFVLIQNLKVGLLGFSAMVCFEVLSFGLSTKPIIQTTYPGQRISLSERNILLSFSVILLISGLSVGLFFGPRVGLGVGISLGIWGGFFFGGLAIIEHCALRLVIVFNNLLPIRLIPFLDYCTDLIFLRRVGGGYIFVHRLLMEHFAAMYPEIGITAPSRTNGT